VLWGREDGGGGGGGGGGQAFKNTVNSNFNKIRGNNKENAIKAQLKLL